MNSKKLFSSILLVGTSLLLFGCKDNSEHVSYNDHYFDISVNQDNSVTLHTLKVDNSYELTISGAGEVVSYAKKEAAPWFPIIKRVSSLTINDGVSNIGDFYFYSLNIDYVILPSSVNEVGDNSFSKNTIIYTYGGQLDNVSNVYYYSKTKPVEDNKYFHLVNGVPYIWKDASILFIGNSFTFRQGTVTEPAVPLYFEKIAENLSQDIDLDFVVKSSYSLTKYANSSDEMGSIVETKLTTKQYDYIILQEQSNTPIANYSSFSAAVKKLNNRIKETQTHCQVYLYETWGYQAKVNDGTYASIEAMELLLREAYRKVGEENDLPVTYVGKVFTYVHVNYSSIDLYASDNYHQTNLGAYLSAACHVKNIFGLDVSLCNEYCSLDEASCKTLLNIANNHI